jgi:hypothetical protein
MELKFQSFSYFDLKKETINPVIFAIFSSNKIWTVKYILLSLYIFQWRELCFLWSKIEDWG